MQHADAPVTIVVTRRVKPGREQAYEAWLERLLAQASALPGYLGASVQRPGPSGPREYTSIFRFATLEQLQAFERSDLRRRALEEVADLVEADAAWTALTGLEFWFAAPPGTVVPQPSRPRMALLLIAVVYLLVLSIGALVNTVMGNLAYPLRLLVTIAIEVSLLTWVVMPWLTRTLARWIYPSARVTT
jgi:antibiotic biosynthesis monooxygenase (ABM) superfamily enzyme